MQHESEEKMQPVSCKDLKTFRDNLELGQFGLK